MTSEQDPSAFFQIFNEIGIIAQLSGTLFESRLPEGVLLSHFSVLNHLVRVRDGATPLQLAQSFQVPKTTMSHTLAGLDKRGWITFRANPRDARSKQVWLTDSGRAFRTTAIAALQPDLIRLAQQLPDLPDRVLPALTELRQLLDAQREPEGVRDVL